MRLGFLSLLVLSVAPNLLWVTVGWVLANVGLNIMLSTLTAAVPDRVPVAQRGIPGQCAVELLLRLGTLSTQEAYLTARILLNLPVR